MSHAWCRVPRWAATCKVLQLRSGLNKAALSELALEGPRVLALIPVYREDGTLALGHEEFPRPQTTLETLATLKPSFDGLINTPVGKDGPSTCTMLATRPASWMALPRFCWLHRTTPRPTA